VDGGVGSRTRVQLSCCWVLPRNDWDLVRVDDHVFVSTFEECGDVPAAGLQLSSRWLRRRGDDAILSWLSACSADGSAVLSPLVLLLLLLLFPGGLAVSLLFTILPVLLLGGFRVLLSASNCIAKLSDSPEDGARALFMLV
jgi:hypothetical protein